MSLSKSIAELSIVVSADTSRAQTELRKMEDTGRRSSASLRESMTEGRAGIKQLGEEIGINLNRHLISFLAKLPGVAPAMAAAFPIAAVIGIGGAIFEAGKRLVEFVERNREAASKISEGFEAMHQGSKLATDELTVTNDKLEQQLAKLTGQRPNNLKLMLHEAVVEADKLVESLAHVEKEQDALLKNKDNQVGGAAGFLMFKMPTASGEAFVEGQAKQLRAIAEEYQEKMDAAKSAEEAQRLRAELRIELLAKEKQQVSDLKEVYNQAQSDYKSGNLALDPSAFLAIIGGRAHMLQDLIRSQAEQERNQDLKPKIAAAEASDKGAMTLNLAQIMAKDIEEQTKNRDANIAFYKELSETEKKATDDFMAAGNAEQKWFATFWMKALDKKPNVVLEGPDRWDNLRVAIDGTILAFTNLPAHMEQFFSQAVGSFNSEMAKAITGQRTNFADTFRSLATSAAHMGLQGVEGGIATHIPSLMKWLNQSKQVHSMNVQAGLVNVSSGATPSAAAMSGPVSGAMSRWAGSSSGSSFGTFLRTIGGLFGLGVTAAGGVGDAGMLSPDFSLDSLQIPLQGMEMFNVPAMAFGGPVLAGMPYDVGEMGRERFVPSTNGTIIPSHAMGGGGAYYEIHAEGADAAAIQQRVGRALEQVHGSAVRNAVAVATESRRRRPTSYR